MSLTKAPARCNGISRSEGKSTRGTKSVDKGASEWSNIVTRHFLDDLTDDRNCGPGKEILELEERLAHGVNVKVLDGMPELKG